MFLLENSVKYPEIRQFGKNSKLRFGLAWFGLAWLGLAWFGLAWLGPGPGLGPWAWAGPGPNFFFQIGAKTFGKIIIKFDLKWVQKNLYPKLSI